MEVMPTRFVKAGQVVFSEGDSADDGLYYICYGEVEISREEPDGTRKLAELSDGAVFGEMAIINTDLRNATVTAKTDCGFFTINRNNFQHKIEQLDPFMRGVFRVLVLEVRDFASHRQRWLEALIEAQAGILPPAPEAPADAAQAHAAPDADGRVHYEPVRPGGGLASGEVRKLQF